MIHEVKSKQKRNGLNVAMKTHTKTQFKGPFISFLQDEYEDRISITFGDSYAEDSRYMDKTYLQLVIDALYEINQENSNKPIELNVDGKFLKIPKDSDKFEIQELLSNFIIKNESFYSDKFFDLRTKMTENSNSFYGDKEKVELKTYADTDFKGPFLEYIQKEYPKKVILEFGRSYADDSRYMDKKYLELVIDAIEQADKNIKPDCYLDVNLGKHIIEIPRDADKFEIQELLITSILKNTTFVPRPNELEKIYDSKEER